MRKYVILAVIGMTAILSYFYLQLGGVSGIEKNVVTVDNYLIVAKPFKGKYNSGHLEDVFYEAKSLGGQLVIVNYRLEGDSTEDGYIHQLIGVQKVMSAEDIPKGFKQDTLAISKVVQARIGAHNLVMPKPDEIEEALRAYAKEQNLDLEGYTIERYISDRELVIEIPIIQ